MNQQHKIQSELTLLVWGLTLSLGLCVALPNAYADEETQRQPSLSLGEDQEEETEDVDAHDISLTLSPLHLILPVLEFHIDGRLADQHSVTFQGKWGRRLLQNVGDIRVYGVGAQYRYYLFGDFEGGMMLALETWYNYERETNIGFEADVESLEVGPCVGYKFILDNGFTLSTQVGLEGEFFRGRVKEDIEDRKGNIVEYRGFFNLDIGWSF